MKKIAVLFSNGTEEIEGITPVDVLRRCGAECDIVSISGEFPEGSHGIKIKADKLIEDVDMNGYDAIVIPGGMPGATYISQNTLAVNAISSAIKNGKLVAAICASPAVVLAEHGLVNGKNVTCYPAQGFIASLKKSNYTGADVEIDGNLISANGPRAALAFAQAICKHLGLTPKF